MDCKNPLYRLQERLNELKTALNNLQIVFEMTEEQIEQLIIRIETIGVKQITKEALKELTEQASELLKYKVECIRESIKREPFPPYKGCIPGSTGNGNPIGSEPGATRRKKAIIKPESLNANEVNLLQKTDI